MIHFHCSAAVLSTVNPQDHSSVMASAFGDGSDRAPGFVVLVAASSAICSIGPMRVPHVLHRGPIMDGSQVPVGQPAPALDRASKCLQKAGIPWTSSRSFGHRKVT